ncbi:MAG: serine hydrolase [Lachnospiraceae bacterium]|nr:serine hydrolase [Lachnospiraceae bacterium]
MNEEMLEQQKRRERQKRIAEMRREKERQERMFKLIKIGVPTLAFLVFLGVVFHFVVGFRLSAEEDEKKKEELAKQEAYEKEMEEIRSHPDGAGFDVTMAEDMSADDKAPQLREGQEESPLLKDAQAEEDPGALLGGSGQDQSLNSPFMEGFDSSVAALAAHSSDQTTGFSGKVRSKYGVLMDAQTGDILAMRNATERISPASMTKVLTILVAAENLPDPDLDRKVVITIQDTDYSYSNDCSAVGFSVDEIVTVRDLFYGTILPSGGDAAHALAVYIAGSMEEFADLMNEKLAQMGLAGSAHFTNSVGLYDEDHYCTIYDMALIMDAAMRNDFCKEVLSAHTYTTSKTMQHPEGITISNWFLRRIEDKDSGGLVVGAKTGYVVQSRNCAVSYATNATGHPFILATATAPGGWKCIHDHVRIYKAFFDGGGFSPDEIADAPEDDEEKEADEGED